jgi:hypothetical protein
MLPCSYSLVWTISPGGARRSGCLISGIGEAPWSILNRGSTGMFFVLLSLCCGRVGNALRVVQAQRHVHSATAQAFRPGLRVRRMLSPLRSIRWASGVMDQAIEDGVEPVHEVQELSHRNAVRHLRKRGSASPWTERYQLSALSP